MNPPVRALILAAEESRGVQLASQLEGWGYVVARHHQLNLADEVLRRERPDLVFAQEASTTGTGEFARVGESARSLQIASLALVGPGPQLHERTRHFDDWVVTGCTPDELLARVEKLATRDLKASLPAIDPRFLALVVHDLRTPLNVIGLTIRAIGQSNPTPSTEFDEDLSFLQENAKQIEKMLAQLGDYCRLVESERNSSVAEFEPRRFLGDLLEEKQAKRDSEYKAVRLELAADSPAVVALDPNRVRLAVSHALANAVAAAGDAPVKLRSRGSTDRWLVEVVVDKPPPPTVATIRLQPHLFERLIGSAAERRGLDLAIAARVSELFGGAARLTVEPGVRSIITLEWPLRAGP